MAKRTNRSRLVFLSLLWLIASSSTTHAAVPKLPHARPQDVGIDAESLGQIDRVVEEGIKTGQMPGCVVAIGRRGKIVLLKAYGHRQVEPQPVAMTTDTLFDMASLTKPIATATSVMILVERGKLRLQSPVAEYLPEFGHNGKQEITVFQLLTHQGGLIPDNSLKDYADGPSEAWRRIFALKPTAAPGSKFIYSDVGYLVLAELVHRVSAKNVHEFSRDNLFRPLGMTETGFLPEERLRQRAAATERREGEWIRGEVHDPRAYRLGGIAGHAGLFSTAEDLAVYAQMMLGRGQYAGVRVLGRSTVAEMTKPYAVSSGLRGLGWDIKTGYSSNRGRSFSPRAFGHGGFTGTAMWIDPELDLLVIFLSSRLHPDGKGSVNPLAGRIGTIAAEAIQKNTAALVPKLRLGNPPSRSDASRPPETGTSGESVPKPELGNEEKRVPDPFFVLTGIDVLKRDGFRQLAGRRVGLITNHTGVDREGIGTARLLHEAANVTLVALFSPEHGLKGKLDVAHVADARHEPTGLQVYSLYGKTRRPTPEMLRGIDTLVFDIQDIGTRFYTYISTMGYAMQAAAKGKIRFVVLDRPNPIGGVRVAGPMLDAGRESFVSFHSLPVRHGMTVGELAQMFNAELRLGLDLQIVKIERWRRDQLFDRTGLKWINPSPNMRSLTEAILYPGIGLLEFTNLSVGRGTETPFEVIGAPWLDGERLARELNRRDLPGVRFTPISFTPESSKFAGTQCGGINIAITDRHVYKSVHTGLEIAHQLRRLHGDTWQAGACDRLLRNKRALDALLAGKPADEIESLGRAELEEFFQRRARFLLYR